VSGAGVDQHIRPKFLAQQPPQTQLLLGEMNPGDMVAGVERVVKRPAGLGGEWILDIRPAVRPVGDGTDRLASRDLRRPCDDRVARPDVVPSRLLMAIEDTNARRRWVRVPETLGLTSS
jgi:hypothetical protein